MVHRFRVSTTSSSVVLAELLRDRVPSPVLADVVVGVAGDGVVGMVIIIIIIMLIYVCVQSVVLAL